MNRKKFPLLVVLAMLCIISTGALKAETESGIKTAREEQAAHRQAVVSANLGLTSAEAEAFWPLYRDYAAEMATVGDRLQAMITALARSYNDQSLTDGQGMAFTQDYLELTRQRLAIRQKYLTLFAQVIPGKSVMRFYQIENKLDASVNSDLAFEIPLVE
jgi:hypothetical protein